MDTASRKSSLDLALNHEEKENDLIIGSDTPITQKSEKPEFEATRPAIPISPDAPIVYSTPEYVPRNGGYGWTFGVFLAHYIDTNAFPGVTRLQFAFVVSLSFSQGLFISPLATLVVRHWGTRATLLIGVLFETMGLVAASFATKVWHLFLSQGICYGWGCCFMFVASAGIVPQWFSTRRSLANSIASAGSGFGGLIYSLATNAMIQSIGLPWAFRILGIMVFVVNVICSLLLKDRNKQINARVVGFDAALFRRPEFYLLLGFGFFSMLGYTALQYSIPNYAKTVGMTAKQGSIVASILSLGQAVGRPPIGFFSDTFGRINMAGLTTFFAGLMILVVWVNAKSFGVLIFYCLLGGTCAGTFWTTVVPVTAEVVGLQDLPAALSMTWVILAIPTTFSEAIGIQIVDASNGAYLGTQLFCGFSYITAAVCLWFLKGWKLGDLELAEVASEARAEDAPLRKSSLLKRMFEWRRV